MGFQNTVGLSKLQGKIWDCNRMLIHNNTKQYSFYLDKTSQQCLLDVIPQNYSEILDCTHQMAALTIITHSSRQNCGTDSCQIRYNICEFKGLRNRHYRYGFSISIGNIVNETKPRISTNSQTSDWHLTSTVPWHRRCYEYEILIDLCTDNIHDLQKERWLFGKVVVHVRIYGSKAAKGFSAFNVCLAIVKIMTCNKKFPPQIKHKNNDHQTLINVDLTSIRHFCVSWLINLFIKFGWQIGTG